MITSFTLRYALAAFASLLFSLLPPASQPSSVVDVDEKTKVHLLGVSSFPADADSWFAFNGEPIELPDQRVLGGRVMTQPAAEHQLAVRIDKPEGTVVRLKVDGATMAANSVTRDDTGDTVLVSAFSLATPAKSAKIEIGLADSEWKTVAANERPGEAVQVDGGENVGAVTFQPAEPEDGGSRCKAACEHSEIHDPNRFVAVDDAGKEYEASNVNVQSDGHAVVTTCTYDVAPEKVKKLLLQTRSFTKFVDVSDISLEKGNTTQPKIEVRTAKR